jgi:glyceraldehyde 3-phosphate dehydrogenase (phosphorylating)
MTVPVGINGFGRVGRSFVRAVHDQSADMEVVAANDLGSVDQMAHLLRFDSVFGRFPGEVRVVDDGIEVEDRVIRFLAEREPKSLP